MKCAEQGSRKICKLAIKFQANEKSKSATVLHSKLYKCIPQVCFDARNIIKQYLGHGNGHWIVEVDGIKFYCKYF